MKGQKMARGWLMTIKLDRNKKFQYSVPVKMTIDNDNTV